MDTHDPGFRALLVENTIDLLSDLRDRTGFTAALAVLTQDQQKGLVLAALPGTSDHGYLPRVGFRFDLHATGPGKALLAFLPAATRSRIISQLELKRFTPNTLCAPDALKAHLKECAAQKLIFDREEYVSGVNCVASCISLDATRPLAAVWITSLVIDLPESSLPRFGEEVRKTVKAMEARLRTVLESPSAKHDYAMERAKLFIEEHFHDDHAIRTYHTTIGMSQSWFRRTYREKYGVAPQSYRLQLLHERACRLLLNTHLSVKEIAYQLGYESQNYFSRTFKNREACSPAHYREKNMRGS